MGLFRKKTVQSGMKGFIGRSGNTVVAGQRDRWSRDGLYNHLEKIFDTQFPQYRLAKNMPVTVISPKSPAHSRRIDFLFCSATSRPLLAVVIVNNSNWVSNDVELTRKACENLHIPFMRFFEELPSETGYVINRVREALG